MIPQYIAKIVLAVISFSLLIYIFLIKFSEYFEKQTCMELYKQGIVKEKCLKYIPELKTIIIKADYNETLEEIAGYVVKCYYDSIKLYKKFRFCYEIIIKNESVEINITDLKEFLLEYTDIRNFVNLTSRVKPYQPLFIYFNESKVYLWQRG